MEGTIGFEKDVQIPFGVPVVIDARGWTQVVPLELWADEAQLLARAAEGLRERIRDWLGEAANHEVNPPAPTA